MTTPKKRTRRKTPKPRRQADRSPYPATPAPVRPLPVPVAERTFTGWKVIADAVGKAIGDTITVRTAQRWAEKRGKGPKLPVFVRPTNGRVYTTGSYLGLWAKAWLSRRRVGAPKRVAAR